MNKIITRTIGVCMNALAMVAPSKAGELGLNIFCYPFRPPLDKKQKEFLSTGLYTSFLWGKDLVQTYRWSHGPKRILLLHGWQSHTYRWKKYIEAINQNDYTLYALDAPGHGLSTGKFLSVPLYNEVIEHFISLVGKIDIVISHSIGSFTALYTFQQNPAIAPEKLVALAPPGEASEFFHFYRSRLQLSERSLRLTTEKFEERFKKSPLFFSAPVFAEALTCPGLIIHDQDDNETPVENARKINRAWKNSRLVITKGYGHNLRSPKVVEEVINFITKPEHAEAL